jgi:hypothetical protein
MPYTLHPSKKLVSLFKETPWQGCNPATAQFLFVGLDANYASDIEKALPEVFEYLHSGVDFWRRTKVHHPFRLPQYQGSGKKYHDKFAQIGFTVTHADLVSFVELLHLPTVGISRLTVDDLSMDHLNSLVNIFDSGVARYIFVPFKVADLMRQTNLFPWLQKKPVRMDGDLAVLRDQSGQIIYKMYHFSCYGWQLKVLNRQIGKRRIARPLQY